MSYLMTICAEGTYFIENLYIVGMFWVVLGPKPGKGQKWQIPFQMVFIYVFQKISTSVSLTVTGGTQFSVLSNIIMICILCFICYQGTVGKRLLTVMLYVIPALISDAIAWILTHDILVRVLGYDVTNYDVLGNALYRNLAIILCAQVLLIIWFTVVAVVSAVRNKRWMKEHFMFLIIPVYQLYILFIYYRFCEVIDEKSALLGWFLYIFGLGIDIAFYYLIQGMIQKIQMEQMLLQLKEKRKRDLEYYLEVNERIEKMRFAKHEFAGQLQVIYGLLEEKENEKGKDLLDAAYEKIIRAENITDEEGEK